MRISLLLTLAAMVACAAPVMAQTAAPPANDTGADNAFIATPLPAPPVDENASVQTLLLAARNALAVGRAGEAQEALEMAETRALDRSVPLFQTSAPILDPLVAHIETVLHTLATGDRLEAMRLLEQAIAESASAR